MNFVYELLTIISYTGILYYDLVLHCDNSSYAIIILCTGPGLVITCCCINKSTAVYSSSSMAKSLYSDTKQDKNMQTLQIATAGISN